MPYVVRHYEPLHHWTGPTVTAVITDQEAREVGVFPNIVYQWGRWLRAMLREKGIPSECMKLGAPCVQKRLGRATVFYFPAPRRGFHVSFPLQAIDPPAGETLGA